MIIAGTGHRPPKLGGYGDEVYRRLVDLAVAALERFQPDHVISGMALGWDQALAEAAAILHIPWTAAVPFEDHGSNWPAEAQSRYRELLRQATEVHLVSDGGYSVFKMHHRDEWMVDHADLILALWDGSQGGTGWTVLYARRSQKRVVNLWPSWQKYATSRQPANSGGAGRVATP